MVSGSFNCARGGFPREFSSLSIKSCGTHTQPYIWPLVCTEELVNGIVQAVLQGNSREYITTSFLVQATPQLSTSGLAPEVNCGLEQLGFFFLLHCNKTHSLTSQTLDSCRRRVWSSYPMHNSYLHTDSANFPIYPQNWG